MKVQKVVINEGYNFVSSTDWPLVNTFEKSVHCWNLLLGLAPKWSKTATWLETCPKYEKKNRLFHGR